MELHNSILPLLQVKVNMFSQYEFFSVSVMAVLHVLIFAAFALYLLAFSNFMVDVSS
jgi:hypothetical protein